MTKEAMDTLVYHGEKVEFGNLINLICHRISEFPKTGLNVGIYLDRTPALVAAVNACLITGNTYIPLDPDHPAERINMILEDVKPDLILTHGHYLSKLPSDSVKIDVDSLSSDESVPEPVSREFCQDRESIAYIIFTSGSTGKPKGVMIPRPAMDNFLDSMAKKPGLTANDRLLAVTTVSFDISVLEIFLPIRTGAQLFLLDKNESHDPDSIISALDSYDITVMQATPVTWRMLIDAGWKGKDNLKVLCGGEALTPELAEELLDRCGELWNMYGPTETTVWSTIEKVERDKPISIGEPIDNTEIYILDENMNKVLHGVEGDLFIGGKGLAAGYFKRPDLTEKVFIPNPFTPGETIYKTGDLVRYMADGRLECLGRSDFQVKIRGFRIELGEIESALLTLDEIASAVVHPQVVRKGMKDLVAYLIERKPVEERVLVEHLSRILPDYMIPAYFVRLDKFLLNTNGKIDRKNLPLPQVKEIVLEGNGDDLSLKEKILFVWKRVLQREDISTDQNFFEIGGNSILAVQLLREIGEFCGLTVPLGAFFMNPVIDDMINQAKSGSDKEMTVLLLNNTTEGVPLFCLGGIDIYSELAACFEGERPVYGVFLPYEEQLIDNIQRGTIDEWEYVSIQGMAGAYLRDIRKYYPQGPCHILGVSIAGMIAFEASKLIKANEGARGELFILDSHLPHARRLTPFGKIYSALRSLKHRSGKPGEPKNKLNPDQAYIEAMRDFINDQAIEVFDKVATPIDGDIYLIRALTNVYSKGESFSDDLGWNDLTSGQVGILELPDDHMGILNQPHVVKLADFLKEKIDR